MSAIMEYLALKISSSWILQWHIQKNLLDYCLEHVFQKSVKRVRSHGHSVFGGESFTYKSYHLGAKSVWYCPRENG